MNCTACGADTIGTFCHQCGARAPEPALAAEVVEAEAEATVANAHATEDYAAAELARSEGHAAAEVLEAETPIVEAIADAAETEAVADVALAAVEALGDVAETLAEGTAAAVVIDELAELEEPPAGDEELELEGEEVEIVEPPGEEEQPPQPDDEPAGDEHVEPITMAGSTPERRGGKRVSAWSRHRQTRR